jgi:hypothetical protein
MPYGRSKKGVSRGRTRKRAIGKAERLEPLEVQLAARSYVYMFRALELGALEGPSIGQMALHPDVERLMKVMHHVLAGGELRFIPDDGPLERIELTGTPDPGTVEELNRLMAEVIAEANLFNEEAGFYKVAIAF